VLVIAVDGAIPAVSRLGDCVRALAAKEEDDRLEVAIVEAHTLCPLAQVVG
jgi:hypothetical protein